MEANPGRTSRRRLTLLGALLLGVASIGSGVTSLALFTDQQDVTSTGFTTGTIDISVTPATAFFSVPNMMPGDSFNTYVTVANDGTSQLRWRVDSIGATGTGGLEDQIDLAIAELPSVACAAWNGSSPLAAAQLSDVSLTDRIVDAGSSVGMCFRASLPLSTGNAFQDKTASTTFRFSAEQTANN